MKTEELKAQGLTEEQISFVMAENGKDISKAQKERDNIRSEADQLKAQLATANESLKKFDGIDPTKVGEEVESYKAKMAELEKNYKAQIEERDYNDTLTKALEGVKFSSEFAKTGIMGKIKEKGLKREGDKILGLDDYMTELKESNKDAFVLTEEAPPAPKFSVPNTGDGSEGRKTYTIPALW